MTTFDWICVVIVSIFTFRAGYLGFVKESKHKVGLIAGIFFAFLFSGQLTVALSDYIQMYNLGRWGLVIVVILLIVIPYLFIHFLLKWLQVLMNVSHGEILDYLLGGLFGILEGAAFSVIIIYLLRIQNIFDISVLFTGSWVVDKLTPILLWMMKFDVGSYVNGFKGVL